MTRTIAVLTCLVLSFTALAAPSQSANRGDLKERFKERYPALERFKAAGVVGETWQGFVALVGDDREAGPIVDAENKDREALYRLMAARLAEEERDEVKRSLITPTVVAERNAVRNFDRAGDREQLRIGKKIWVTKQDRPWLLRLLELEGKGSIGERRDGYVTAPRPEDARDPEISRVVEKENEARRMTYEKEAAAARVALSRIAASHAERRFEAAHIGVLLEGKDGVWAAKAPE